MKLGRVQEAVLRSLTVHGGWHDGCGWVWDTPSGTIRVLETLVKRGLVTKTRRPNDNGFGGRDRYEAVENVRP